VVSWVLCGKGPLELVSRHQKKTRESGNSDVQQDFGVRFEYSSPELGRVKNPSNERVLMPVRLKI
jgi:hypothetical protein